MSEETTKLIHSKYNDATRLHQQGFLDGAIELYESILELDSRHADATHLKGLAHYQRGELERGLEYMERGIALSPGDAGYHSNAGSALKALGRLEEAVAAYERSAALAPDFLPAYFNAGEAYCLLERLEEGERAYRKALSLNDRIPDVWTNLGLCLLRREKYEESEEALMRALQLDPSFMTALYGLARLTDKLDRLAEAQNFYAQAMRAGFDAVDCLTRLVGVCQRLDDAPQTVIYLEQLIALTPDDPNAYNNLALAWEDLGEREKACGAVNKALELEPLHLEALCTKAAFLNGEGDFEGSIRASKKALFADRNCEIAHNNLGASYRSTARFEEAAKAYRSALAINPDRAECHNNLALVLQHLGDVGGMEEHFQRAVELRPDYAAAYSNYGSALIQEGRLSLARQLLEKALEVDPECMAAWGNQGRLLYELGEAEACVGSYERCLELDPMCSLALMALPATQVARDDISDAELFARHRSMAESLESSIEACSLDLPSYAKGQGGKIRLGFVSADFRVHSVAFFLLPLLRHLDRTRFEVYCYSGVARPDGVTKEFEGLADGWRAAVDMPDERVAETILRDRIDILVDLSGCTSGNRMKVFARKPAPVQATWLGYAHSTGLSRMDYRIVDQNTDPEGMTLNSEELYRLPDCFLVYSPAQGCPDVAPPPSLAGKPFTFGSFNNITKLNRASVGLFSKALKAVEGSRLILKSHQIRDDAIQERVLGMFEAEGIERSRVQLLPRVSSVLEHLALYSQMDVALDTLPYNGTTTTCEALWMGVPVLTLAGARHAARVGCSLLKTIGAEELVAASEEDFVALARQLASDPARLAALRGQLRERVKRSPLHDEKAFAAKMGAAFEDMWRRFEAASLGLESSCLPMGEA